MMSRLRALLYFLFLGLSFPAVFVFLTVPALIFATLSKYFRNYFSRADNKYCDNLGEKKIVLVTGAPHTKGLQVCRILKSAGHKIILADMRKFRFSAARFSTSVDKWVSLPDITDNPRSLNLYKEQIKSLIKAENVDWWIPVSHTVTAVIDTIIKEELEEENSKVKVMATNNKDMVEMLDDKIRFLEKSRDLGLPVPGFYKISSCQDVIQLCRQNVFSGRHYFLKPLSLYSEDRVCFDKLPDNEEKLKTFLRKYETKISPATPYFVSEFVKGQEWTGNIIAKSGQIYIYTSNPSSPVQIDYQDASSKTKIFDWIKEFVSSMNLSGSLCFDFLEDPLTGEMLCIECNPRLHSAIVLINSRRREAAAAIYSAMQHIPLDVIATPDPDQRHVYWTYNELAKLLHGENPAAVLSTLLQGRDAVWDLEDPLPFFLLPHLQITSLLWDAIISGEQWSIVNYCLGQLR